MRSARTYTMAELEAASGFDRRTISYYISYGLLPKVGRRGPKTSYTQGFLDRLMLIRRIRDMQEAGKLTDITLRDIGEVMQRLTGGQLHAATNPERYEIELQKHFSERNREFATMDSLGEATIGGDFETAFEAVVQPSSVQPTGDLASAKQRRHMMGGNSAPMGDAGERGRAYRKARKSTGKVARSPEEMTSAEIEGELTTLLTAVDASAGSSDENGDETVGESLLRVPITNDVLISVRNISKEDAGLVERLAALLRKLTKRVKR